jgi:hypothetical protein
MAAVLGLTLADEHVLASSLLNFELRRKMLQPAQAWAAVALDEESVTGTIELVHCGRY